MIRGSLPKGASQPEALVLAGVPIRFFWVLVAKVIRHGPAWLGDISAMYRTMLSGVRAKLTSRYAGCQGRRRARPGLVPAHMK
jgi:hypothetical protein